MDLRALWHTVLGEIELSISRANFVTWFKNTAILKIDDTTVTLAVPNGFAKEWIEQKCAATVIAALRKHGQHIETIRCILAAPQQPRAMDVFGVNRTQRPSSTVPRKTTTSDKNTSLEGKKPVTHPINPPFPRGNFLSHLNPRYTFASFVVGAHNELAHAACRTVSESLGTAYNPLFIYGGVGLGKTHLLQSIGNAVIAADPTKNVLYTSSERFTSELIDSIHNNTISDFKRHYQKINLLIIDDIQFLAGKEKTQDEFFHIFNFLYQQNRQIIISSDRPPHAIATLEDRLRSRFEGGMIADITQPDFETRVAILQKKADERDLILPEDAARFIAKNIATNVRELEGALNKIAAICSFQDKIPSLGVVEEILGAVQDHHKTSLTPQNVITTVALHFKITQEDLLGKTRKKTIVVPRQIAMRLLREELACSYPEIGMHCGGRDHTTALHACRKIEKSLQYDHMIKENYEAIRMRLRTA